MLFIHSLILLLLSWPLFAQDEGEINPPNDPAVSTENPLNTTADEGSGQGSAENPSEDAINKQADSELQRDLPDPSKRRIIETVKHLNLYQRESEVIKFSDEESSISGLYLPENTGSPQGGILILHDIDQHAHWPHTIAPLREYLPDYGWNTLSLFFGNYINEPLPIISVNTLAPEPNDDIDSSTPDNSEPVAPINNKEESLDEALATEAPAPEDENFNSNGTGDALDEIAENFEAFNIPEELESNNTNESAEISPEDAFLQTMYERVEGGLSQLNTLGQFNIVIIAHGLSANWAVEALRKRFEQTPNIAGYSLILVDAKPSTYPNYPLNEELAKLEIPILDLYTKISEDSKREITARRNAIVRQQKAKYMQIGLPAFETIHTNKHNMITRRVRGWLKTHAAGEEVMVKERRG